MTQVRPDHAGRHSDPTAAANAATDERLHPAVERARALRVQAGLEPSITDPLLLAHVLRVLQPHDSRVHSRAAS